MTRSVSEVIDPTLGVTISGTVSAMANENTITVTATGKAAGNPIAIGGGTSIAASRQSIDAGLPPGTRLRFQFTVIGMPSNATPGMAQLTAISDGNQIAGSVNFSGAGIQISGGTMNGTVFTTDELAIGPSGGYTILMFASVSGNQGAAGRVLISRACALPVITGNSSGNISVNCWTAGYAVSTKDGLELIDVKLGGRHFAEKINLPYFKLKTSSFSSDGHCELTPDSASDSCRSHLADLRTDGEAVQAIYIVDKIDDDSQGASCLVITQRFLFGPLEPQGCEPTESLTCHKFFPLVDYTYVPDDASKQLTQINVAQRFEFTPDLGAGGLQTVAVFKDCDGIPGVLPLSFCAFPLPYSKLLDENPLSREVFVADVIKNGGAGSWDNFHQTPYYGVDEPIDLFPPDQQPPHLFPPGCPECVHIHWRWSNVFADPRFNDGKPLIPAGSDQSVDIAVVSTSKDPHPDSDFSQLPTGQRIAGNGFGSAIAFWYGSTSGQPSNSFFTHGVFFRPEE